MVYKLREIRKLKGLTQVKLSEVSKINRVCIAKYETGKSTPTLESAEKLAKALGVKVDDLIGEEAG